MSKVERRTDVLRSLYRLLGTGIVECLEIIDVGCNLKQFDSLTLVTAPPPLILRQIYATGLKETIMTKRWQKYDTTCIRLDKTGMESSCLRGGERLDNNCTR